MTMNGAPRQIQSRVAAACFFLSSCSLREQLARERGQSIGEYALLFGVVVAIAAVGLSSFGGALHNLIQGTVVDIARYFS